MGQNSILCKFVKNICGSIFTLKMHKLYNINLYPFILSYYTHALSPSIPRFLSSLDLSLFSLSLPLSVSHLPPLSPSLSHTHSGAAIALSTVYLLSPVLLIVYIKWRRLHQVTWGGWSWEALHDWGQYLKLGIPGIAELVYIVHT